MWRSVQVSVALAIVLWVLGLIVQLRAPDAGYGDSPRADGTMLVTEVDPDGPAARAGLHAGDIIVADPGPHLNALTERELFERVRALHSAFDAHRLPLTVRRDGVERSIVVAPTNEPSMGASVRQLRRIAPLFPPLLAYFAMAVVLARRPREARPEAELVARRRVALAFAILGISFGFNWVAPGWPSSLVLVSAVITNTCPPVSLALLGWFAWSFPRVSRFATARWLPIVVAALIVPASTISILENLGLVRIDLLPGNRAQIVADSLLLVALIVGLVWQRRRVQNDIERRQLNVLLGTFVFCLFLAASLLARPTTASMFGFSVTLGAAVAIPIAFAVALGRYRLFAFDAFVIRTSVYLIVTSISLLAYVIVAEAVIAFAPTARSDLARWAGLALAIGVAAPARAATERAWGRLVGRDPEAFLTSCFRAVGLIGAAASREALLRTIRDELGVERAELVEVAGPGGARTVASLDDTAAVDELTRRGLDVIAWLDSSVALAISRPTTLGAIGSAERIALENVAAALASWLQRNEAENQLRSRIRDGEEARKRIAMELHDGLGATLTAAKVMTQLLRGESADDGRLSSLERTLSDGLVELRTTLASVDTAAADWDDTVARLRRHVGDACANAGIAVELHVHSADGADPSAAARLSVLRIAQEAVTNTVRHARAQHVWCSVEATHDRVTLTYEDDGVGIPAEGARGEGRGLRNMASRARSLGGSLSLAERPLGGVRLVAVVPTREIA